MSSGKVRVVVKSRRVPVRTVNVAVPTFSSSGVYMGTKSSNVVLYDSALDAEHARAVKEGRRLSCDLGLDLEVVDESRHGLLRRALSVLGLSGSGRPSFVVSPSSSQSAGALTR